MTFKWKRATGLGSIKKELESINPIPEMVQELELKDLEQNLFNLKYFEFNQNLIERLKIQ